jgi:replicative DNA helicase
MGKVHFRSGHDLLAGWRDDVLLGKADPVYAIGSGELARFPVAPGRVTLIGGAPGAGKTAFTMQAAIDAVRMNETVRACICNIEMPPSVLLDRQLARLSGIDLTTIIKRELEATHAERVETGIGTLEAVADRFCFVASPYDLGNVAAAADEFGANLLVLDYIQRIPPPGDHGDKRGSVDATMDYLRQFANDAEMAVIVVAAVARTKDKKGRSSYDASGLNLASFRESSELEYGSDDAFILTPANDDGIATLKHLKSRYGEARDFKLHFDAALQRFTGGDQQETLKPNPDLSAAWAQTKAAPEGRS